MNNEPVAWVQTRAELNNEGAVIAKYTAVKFNSGFEDLPNETPLYTHPAKTLIVTLDDCVEAELEQDVGYGGNLDMLEYAKAILRKAQEK